MIAVTMVGADSYELVHEYATGDGYGKAEASYRFTLSPATYRDLCAGRVTYEWLIVQAFRYLLDTRGREHLASSYDLGELCTAEPGFIEAMRERTAPS